MTNDEFYMQRCLQLAKLGMPYVYPNPLVGCVIVKDNKIISESYHKYFGGLHAEANAIEQVVDKSILKDCTLYVNLEPCAHTGKTPPCANAIVCHHFKRVVIGKADPFEKVNGKGIQILNDANIEVEVGVLENECFDLNKRFYTNVLKYRPYIILKWAQTADGFLGKIDTPNLAISNQYSRQLTHLWRSQEHAILIGCNTANIDNPTLTTRFVDGKNPIRFIIDLNGKLKSNLSLLNDGNKTFVFSTHKKTENGNVSYLEIKNSENILAQILKHLNHLQIASLIIEGGAFTLNKFLETGIWDEARVFKSSNNMNDGIKAPIISITQSKSTQSIIDVFSNDLLTIYQNY